MLRSPEQPTVEIVTSYVNVWNEPEADSRRVGVSSLWSPDGAEFVEGAVFRGHDELNARIAGAYEEFVASGRYAVTAASDASRHEDIVTFTIRLTTPAGEIGWAARVFLLLDANGLIQEDYQLTVEPFGSEA